MVGASLRQESQGQAQQRAGHQHQHRPAAAQQHQDTENRQIAQPQESLVCQRVQWRQQRQAGIGQPAVQGVVEHVLPGRQERQQQQCDQVEYGRRETAPALLRAQDQQQRKGVERHAAQKHQRFTPEGFGDRPAAGIASDVAGQHIDRSPGQRREHIDQQKPPGRHVEHAGDHGDDGTDGPYEAAQYYAVGTVTTEEAFSPVDPLGVALKYPQAANVLVEPDAQGNAEPFHNDRLGYGPGQGRQQSQAATAGQRRGGEQQQYP